MAFVGCGRRWAPEEDQRVRHLWRWIVSEWTLILPMIPDSMNVRERTSFWGRKKELEQITTALGTLALEAGIPAASGRRSVLVTIHKGKRSRVRDDPANRDSRAKSVLDALVKLGLLVDDNDTHLEWLGVVEGAKRELKETVITLGDCA